MITSLMSSIKIQGNALPNMPWQDRPAGFSKDGFKWDINPETIKFEGADPEIGEWVYGYDPRVAIYYGCADTVTGLAFGYIPEIIEFTKRTNIL